MFIDILEYITLPREIRRNHLDMTQQCIEIGGSSQEFRGNLAFFLKTTLSKKNSNPKVLLCHACNNSKCSNVHHLYWGTHSDNMIDSHAAGNYESINSRTVKIYGAEKAKEIFSRGGKKSGGKNRLTQQKLLLWRNAIDTSDPHTRGWIGRISMKMECTHTQTRRILSKYFPDV